MTHGHRRVELLSIALHRAVAERLEQDPEILPKARARVEQWLADGGPTHPVYARRWQRLLARPLAEITKALVADTEEMRDLRQTSPFSGALTEEERRRIVRDAR